VLLFDLVSIKSPKVISTIEPVNAEIKLTFPKTYKGAEEESGINNAKR
jgi:hypothetical protein